MDHLPKKSTLFFLSALLTLFVMIVVITLPALPFVAAVGIGIFGGLMSSYFGLKFLRLRHEEVAPTPAFEITHASQQCTTASVVKNLQNDKAIIHTIILPPIDNELTKSPFDNTDTTNVTPEKIVYDYEGLGPNGDNILGL